MKIKIGLIDDHELVELSLKQLFKPEEDISLAWAATDEESAEHELSQDPVDVILVDLELRGYPHESGLQVLKQLRRKRKGFVSIVFSSHMSPFLVREASRAGAVGYYCKTEFSGLCQGIRQAARGAKEFIGPHAGLIPEVETGLSPREIEVLRCLAKGMSNPEIGQILGVQRGTVKTHIERIYQKLGVANRTSALTAGLAGGYLFTSDLMEDASN